MARSWLRSHPTLCAALIATAGALPLIASGTGDNFANAEHQGVSVGPQGEPSGAMRARPPLELTPAYDGELSEELSGDIGRVEKIREGTPIVERVGRFIPTGGGLVFQSSDNKLRLTGLANLNLERIARAVQNSADPLEWTVSGDVTEYRGANYLLVTKALFRQRISKPQR